MNQTSAEGTLADAGELAFIRWIRAEASKQKKRGSEILLGIGDDAAVLRLARDRAAVVTTDALLEGVHFRREWISPRDLGRKAMAANLSDLAAMAARPIAAFLSVGVPSQTPARELKEFFRGALAEGRAYGCALAGGDLVRAPEWVINVMLVGSPTRAGRAARRSAARAGQSLYITGWPGESGAGLEALRRGAREPKLIARHNRPTPRLPEATALARLCPDLAMIDVSDGIQNDAGHLARESKTAIRIELERLPLSPAMRAFAGRIAGGNNPRAREIALDWALGGGEDYELLFATRKGEAEIARAFKKAGLATPVARIGRITRGRGVHLIGADGIEARRRDPVFRHFV